LRDANAAIETLRSDNKKLSDKVEEFTTLVITKDVDEAFETYKDVRKLKDADREIMTITRKSNPEVFLRAYPKVKPQERHLMRDVVTPENRETTKTGTDDSVQMGGRPRLKDLTNRIMRDNAKLSRAEASNLAAKTLGLGFSR
jgi:hypothetical protein